MHAWRRYRLHIVGEVSVDVRHCLMALPGVAKHELRRVQSHPQARPLAYVLQPCNPAGFLPCPAVVLQDKELPVFVLIMVSGMKPHRPVGLLLLLRVGAVGLRLIRR